MPRKVFYSFHYKPDNWRVSQIRNIGAVEGSPVAHDNDWEQIARQGDAAIQRWINTQMDGRSAVVVLIGSDTAQRKWIDYEIRRAWSERKGLFGVHIHNLKDRNQQQTFKGANPFAHLSLNARPLSQIVEAHDPPYWQSADVYAYIADNLEAWIERAIRIRASYG